MSDRIVIGMLPALLLTAACNSVEPQPRQDDDADVRATHDVRVVEIATGLEHPWGLAFLPGGDMLITERPGRVRLFRDGQLRAQPVAGAPTVDARGQGGLLDIALHPDFATNGLVYMTYSKAVTGGATTALARARWQDDRLDGIEDIFVAQAAGSGGQHFGSRIVFDGAGHVYITIGDRGEPQRAQDLRDHAGTTLRLHDDGRVPADNPFAGRNDALPEIYTNGNRNAQGMARHPQTGAIWQSEHGPRGGDELNRMRAGANYGWPLASFGNHYDGRTIPDPRDGDGFEAPVAHWVPAIAPAGMTFYTGDRFPNWRGNAFIGALVGQQLRRVVLDGTRVLHQQELLAGYGARIRDVREGPDGYLYILTDASNGVLARLQPDS
jgi:aldose sugar dehydrogenase